MYNVPAAVDASCTPQTEITAAIDHIELYMILHIRCAKSIWFYYFEKPFYICSLQLKCPEIQHERLRLLINVLANDMDIFEERW